MSLNVDPIPIKDDLLDAGKKMGGNWFRWLGELLARVLAATSVVASTHRTGLGASLPATTIYTSSQPATFRVSWAIQVTTPGTLTGTVLVTITWTNGVGQTEAFPVLNGNLTTTHGSGSIVIRPDAGLPIKYATTYTTTGATPMAYMLDVFVEQATAA